MKPQTKLIVSTALSVIMLVTIPNQGAFASLKANAPSTAGQKAGLATCATFDQIVSFANSFSKRKKGKDAAANKAAAQAALASLRGDFATLQSELNAAIHLDPSYRSWQGPASVLESFNGNNGSEIGSAVITLMSYCAKIHK